MDFIWILYLALILFTYIKDCFGSCTTKVIGSEKKCTRYKYPMFGDRYCINYKNIDFYKLICHNITVLGNYKPEDIGILEIYSSQMKELKPEFFNGFVNIISVIMNADEINIIQPGTFNGLSNLENLDLRNNNIRVLPKGTFNAMMNVKNLNVAQNNISEIETHAFTGMNKLETLVLKDNKITDTEHLLPRCDKLEVLDLSNNNITFLQLPSNCTNLKYLNIAYNNIQGFTENSRAINSLVRLDISFNNLDSFEPNILEKFKNLEKLNLSHNPISQTSEMPVDLFQNTLSLTLLNLSSTGIQTLIVGTFARLHKLEILDLSSNRLSNLPVGIFHDLIALRNLYLNKNYLTYFSLNEFTKLEYIDLNDNLWNCHTVSSITKELTVAKVKIARGYSYNTTNIYGISCTEMALSTPSIDIPSNNSDNNLNHHQREQNAFLERIHDNVKQISSHQNNISDELKFQLENYLMNFTRDYQHFFNNVQNDVRQISLDQRNISNQMNLQQQNSYTNLNTYFQNFFQSIQKDVQQMLHYFRDAFTLKNSSLVLQDNSTKSQYDEQRTINELKAVLIESNVIQRNYSDLIQNSQSNFEKLLLQVMAKFNSTENLSQIVAPSMYKSDFLTGKDSKSSYKGDGAIVTGLYCIVIVLVVGFALLLLVIRKKFKIYRGNNDECNPLNAMQV